MAPAPKNSAPPEAEPPGENVGAAPAFASPPCLACELDPGYFDRPPPLPERELIAFLNRLLEAERAGAKTLAAFRRSAALAAVAADLAVVGRDEARYVAMLGRAVRDLGGTPSAATGDFFAKATAIADAGERLRFLNRGQGWVARKLTETLPRIRDAALQSALAEMHRTHVENIQRCDALIEKIAPGA